MRVKELSTKFEKFKSEMQTQIKSALYVEIKEIFAKYPKMQDFSWAQYTPYFNDGDECIFYARCDSDSLNINGRGRWGDYDDADEDVIDGKLPEWHMKAADEISDLLNSAGDEILKTAFGDHVEITAHRDGTFSEETYEHD